MSAVGPFHDEIGIDPWTELNDFNPLAMEWMTGMGDGHESRTRSGCGGSVWRTRPYERARRRDPLWTMRFHVLNRGR